MQREDLGGVVCGSVLIASEHRSESEKILRAVATYVLACQHQCPVLGQQKSKQSPGILNHADVQVCFEHCCTGTRLKQHTVFSRAGSSRQVTHSTNFSNSKHSAFCSLCSSSSLSVSQAFPVGCCCARKEWILRDAGGRQIPAFSCY